MTALSILIAFLVIMVPGAVFVAGITLLARRREAATKAAQDREMRALDERQERMAKMRTKPKAGLRAVRGSK